MNLLHLGQRELYKSVRLAPGEIQMDYENHKELAF